MRKIILSLMAVSAMVMFSGCAGGPAEGLAPSGGKYHVWNKNDGVFSINPIGKGPSLKEELRVAATESQKKGFDSFVILNTGSSNMEGFPINRYSELKRYYTLRDRKPSFQTNGKNQRRGDHPLRSPNGSFQLWFKPVNKTEFNNTYISLWDVEQTLRDTM